MRICSFLPSATEILYALGIGSRVVGVSHECDYPPEALTKPRIVTSRLPYDGASSAAIDQSVRRAFERGAPLYQIDHALLRRLSPDLIVTQALCEVCAVAPADVTEAIRTLPVRPRIITLHPHTLDEVLEDIREVGRATACVAEADALVRSCRARLARLQGMLRGLTDHPRVFCLEWLDPPMASGHWVPNMVELAGGHEVLGRAGQPSRSVTSEEIVAARPDILILMPCGFSIDRTRQEVSVLKAQAWWHEIPAVRHGRVYVVNGPAYFNRSGPRLIDGVERLAALMHPQRCAGLVPPGERAGATL